MDYQKLVDLRNLENPFASLVGIQVTKIEQGYAEAVLSLRPEHLNPVNAAHGGCLYTLADVAAGSAGASYGTKTVTVSAEYHYLAPAINTQTLIARATCLHAGNSILPVEVVVSSGEGILLGKSTFTLYRLKKETICLD